VRNRFASITRITPKRKHSLPLYLALVKVQYIAPLHSD